MCLQRFPYGLCGHTDGAVSLQNARCKNLEWVMITKSVIVNISKISD